MSQAEDYRTALAALLAALDDEGWCDDPSWRAIEAVESAMEEARELLGWEREGVL